MLFNQKTQQNIILIWPLSINCLSVNCLSVNCLSVKKLSTKRHLLQNIIWPTDFGRHSVSKETCRPNDRSAKHCVDQMPFGQMTFDRKALSQNQLHPRPISESQWTLKSTLSNQCNKQPRPNVIKLFTAVIHEYW